MESQFFLGACSCEGFVSHYDSLLQDVKNLTIIKGDGLSASIAAASILAKVSRDRYAVEELERLYPEYQFARHKGYGTKLHYAMLDEYGPCPAHRKTFLKKWEQRKP